MILIRLKCSKNSFSRLTTGNTNGQNITVSLLGKILIALFIIGQFNCSFLGNDIIEEAYEHYITQDTVALFRIIGELDSNYTLREFKIISQFGQLSKGNFELQHGIIDTGDVWYKIFEGRKHYLNGDISLGYKILKSAYLNINQYPWYVRSEMSFRFLELSRQSPYHNRTLLKNTLLRSESLGSNVSIQNASELINFLYHAELQKDYGNTKHAQNIAILVLQIINVSPFKIPEIRALALSILSTLAIEETNTSAEKTLERLIEFTERYPILNFYNTNALSNMSYFRQINGDKISAEKYNERALYESQHIPLAHSYALQNSIYNKINAGQYEEALSFIDANIDYESKTHNKISLHGHLLKAKVILNRAPDRAFEILENVINEASEYQSIKGLAAFELAKLHFNKKNTAIDSCLKYLNIFKHQFDEIYKNEISIHYSDIYHQYTSILLDCLFHKNLDSMPQELLILKAMEYGKNQSIKFQETNTPLSQYDRGQLEYLSSAETNYMNYENNSDYIETSASSNSLQDAIGFSRSLSDKANYRTIESNSMNYTFTDLNSNQLLLSYFYTGDYYYTAAISNKSIEVDRIPSDSIEPLITTANKNLRTLNGTNELEERDNLRLLFKKLIEPYASNTIIDITILPDYLLYTIPYESLINENGKYLVETCDVSYSTSLQRSLSKETEIQHKSISILSYTDIDTYKSRDVKKYPELRHALTEVDVIARQSSVKSINIFQGHEMTEGALNKSLRSDLVHIITHAKSNENIVSDNYFLLRDKKGNPVKEYGFQLKGKKLSSTLIVLSGCETGVGKFVYGEGANSLSRQFLESGARNVVKSLWSINDAYSHHFFELFYQNVQNQNYKKALSQAKRTLISKSTNQALRRPHFWSNYVLMN